MKRFFPLALLAVIGMAAVAAADTISGVQTAGTELIVNGGFENVAEPLPMAWGDPNPAGWTENAMGEVYLVPYYSHHEGTYAYNMYTVTESATTLTAYQEHTYTDGFASNVSSLAFDGWANLAYGTATTSVIITTGNMTGDTFTLHDTLTRSTSSADWTELTGNAAVRHGGGINETNYVKITLTVTGTTTMSCGFDGLSLTTIPEPSTMTLMAVGLVGLLAYAWRKRK